LKKKALPSFSTTCMFQQRSFSYPVPVLTCSFLSLDGKKRTKRKIKANAMLRRFAVPAPPQV